MIRTKPIMKNTLFILSFFTSIIFLQAQDIQRVEINGRISVDTEDKEGITVYNQSSNKGTTTDDNGTFSIEVALNDVVAFGALQFQDFAISIDERIMKSRQVTVRLVEDVNKLDEVVVLPYDLSGDINTDVNAVRTFNVDMNEIYKGEEDNDDYQFAADNKTKVDSPILDENRFFNGVDFTKIYRMFFKKKPKPESKLEQLLEDRSPIAKRYDAEYLKTNFNIPTDLYEAFINYVEDKGYNEELLEKKKEILLLDYLLKESQLFLISKK